MVKIGNDFFSIEGIVGVMYATEKYCQVHYECGKILTPQCSAEEFINKINEETV